MFKADVCVLIPTLNEEEAIAGVIKALPKKVGKLRVKPLVIDGNSTDDTVKRAKKAGAPVIMQKSKGKGAAIAEALQQIDAKYIVLIDGDGTYEADKVGELVRPLVQGKTDMTVATRLEKRDHGAITLFNTIGNHLFNFLIRFFYGKKITDMLTGYRAISMKKLEELNLVTKNFEFETEITIEALRNNLRVMEFPLYYRVRKGKTKLNPLHDGLRIMKTLILMIRDTKPLLFFSIIGFLFILFGLWPASFVLYEKLRFGEVQHLPSAILAAFSFLLGLQIIILGILADMSLTHTKRIENLMRKKLGRG